MKYHKGMVKYYTKSMISDAEGRLRRIQGEILSIGQLLSELQKEENEIVEWLRLSEDLK